MDEPVGGCMRRLRCQTNTAAASTAASRQPPSARPMARPGPASWVAPGSLVAFEPTSGNGGGAGEGTPTSGDGGGGVGASRITWNWTATTDGAAGNSSMVIPNTLLIALRGFARKATAADSTWLAAPAVSVATTVRITLPASTVTVKTHVGKKQRSSWRKLSLTESAFASYSSTVPTAFSTKVTSLADTISLVAPGGNDGGGGCGVGGGGGGNTGGLGGGSISRREPQSLQSVPNAHIDPKAFQPPSWQTVSPAVPQVSRQIIGGGEAGGGCGGNGGGAGSTVTEPSTPVKSTK